MSIISFSNVNKSYRKKNKALNNISFEVKSNTITGLIGRNGAGKSTTINLLANILKPDSGEIKVLNEILKPGNWKYKSSVGFILEKYNFVENLTGKEYLNFASVMHNLDRDYSKTRINELLSFLDMENESSKLIREYSKGMKKKLAFAASLLHKPQLLILDEPLEGIDPVSANATKKLLRSLVSKGVTVFISSHELGTLQDLCDKIIIIHKGENIFQGSFDELRKQTNISVENVSLEELFIRIIGEDRIKELSW